MLSSSWRAKGKIRDAWRRLDVDKDQRGELARRTGITATNLSGMNTGRLPTTLEAAERIVAAVPGLTVDDLRGSTAQDPRQQPEPEIERAVEDVARRVAALEAGLSAVEQALETLRLETDDPPAPRAVR